MPLDSVWALDGVNAAFFQRQIGQAVIGFAVRTRLKVVL
jgi:hypothetical protein